MSQIVPKSARGDPSIGDFGSLAALVEHTIIPTCPETNPITGEQTEPEKPKNDQIPKTNKIKSFLG